MQLSRPLCLALVAAALSACATPSATQPSAAAPPAPAATKPAVAVATKPAAPAAVADPSLTHRYSFTDLKDSVGKVDATLKGTAKLAAGKVALTGEGMGSDDANLPYIEFSGALLPKSGSASIAVWFTCSATSGTAPRLLDIGDRNGNVGNAFIYFAPHFATSDNFRAKISATDSSSGTPLEGPRLDDGKPHLVVIALTDTQMHVFVDGAEPTPAVDIGGNNLAAVRQVHSWIGRSGFDQDTGITGSIDEVRTYSKALTLAEAAALAKAGADTLPAK